ncbi:MAG: ATP-binding protein [Chitinophagaceae bacterium]
MPNFSRRLIFLLIVCSIALTLSLSFLFKRYEPAVSGILIIILFTAFLPGWKSTLVAGIVGMVVMSALAIYFNDRGSDLLNAMFSQVYSLLVIVVAVIIVFYLKRLHQNFAYEKTHMTSLFENATEGILLTESNGKIVLANPASLSMFGYLAEEILGKEIELLIPARYHGKHSHLRSGFYKKPSNRSMGIGRELFAQRKDGSEFPVEISLSHYNQKSETFVIAFIVDITARKEFEKNLLHQKVELEKISNDIRKLNAELEDKVEERTLILKEALQKLEQSQHELNESLDKEKQLNEIKSRFVSMASHEFRTPLSTILSSATLVSKYPSTEEFEKREKHIRRIKDSVSHLNEMLEDFLSLGKLEAGKVGISISSFSVQDFAEELVDEMRFHLKPDQQIILEISGEPNFVTDKRMLKNILHNLLSNASKFSSDGKAILFKTITEKNHLSISVKDEGMGIAKEDQVHLFETFFRANNVSNIQGTGLGLPIVKRYVNLLGGSIEIRSELEEGTVILLNLPVKPIDRPGMEVN